MSYYDCTQGIIPYVTLYSNRKEHLEQIPLPDWISLISSSSYCHPQSDDNDNSSCIDPELLEDQGKYKDQYQIQGGHAGEGNWIAFDNSARQQSVISFTI